MDDLFAALASNPYWSAWLSWGVWALAPCLLALLGVSRWRIRHPHGWLARRPAIEAAIRVATILALLSSLTQVTVLAITWVHAPWQFWWRSYGARLQGTAWTLVLSFAALQVLAYWCAKHPRGWIHQHPGVLATTAIAIPLSVSTKIGLLFMPRFRSNRLIYHFFSFPSLLHEMLEASDPLTGSELMFNAVLTFIYEYGVALLALACLAALAIAVAFHIHGRRHPHGWLRRVRWRPWLWWPLFGTLAFLELAGAYLWVIVWRGR